MNESTQSAPGRSFLIIGVVALIWNMIGIMTYLMDVMMSPEALAEMSPEQIALRTGVPAFVTGAYAIGVYGGTLACIGLLFRKAWAVPLFAVSLVAIFVQMGHALLISDMLALLGPTSAILPVMIIAIASFMLWYSLSAKKKGWLT